MYSETTRSIKVTVKPFYLEDRSSPAEDRLLADNAGASHFLHSSVAVCDLPVAVAQLDCLLPAVLDADVVGPHVTVFGR